jgi:hypothetical protein
MRPTGEQGGACEASRTVMGADELQRIALPAGVDRQPTDLHRLAYQDRKGDVHLPLDGILDLAHAFAKAEPHTVTEYLDDAETELRLRASVPGDHWNREHLRDRAPAFALARRWAGLEHDAALLREEIARLRGHVHAAADELKTAGSETAARRLERALAAGSQLKAPYQFARCDRGISPPVRRRVSAGRSAAMASRWRRIGSCRR